MSRDNQPPSAFFDYTHLGMGYLALLGIAFLLAISLLGGAFLDPRQFAFSYLCGYLFYFTVAAGAFFWLVLHYAVNAEWSIGVRRQLENVGSLWPTLIVLFIPVVLVAPILWPWMQGGHSGREIYLNVPFFWVRAFGYLAFFLIVSKILGGLSLAQDKGSSPRGELLSKRLAIGSLIPFALCITFCAIDWVMSLQSGWFSAVWGVYLFAGSILAGLAALIVIVTALRSAGYLREVVTVEHYHILGKLLFAFTMFWGYIAFSQYMLIWYASIPEETSYLALRGTPGWKGVSIALAGGHFLIPFLLLLSRDFKRKPQLLCAVAAWLLFMHFVDLYLMVMPVLHPGGIHFHILDIFCVLAPGCVLAIVFLKNLGDSALYPIGDPRLAASITLKNE